MKVRPLRPEMVPKVKAWIEKWSKYEAYGGGTLPEGYMRYAAGESLDDMAHSFEKNEFEAVIEKHGEDIKHDPWGPFFDGECPLTAQCHEELLPATSYDDVDAHRVLLKPFMEDGAEITRIKKLSGL